MDKRMADYKNVDFSEYFEIRCEKESNGVLAIIDERSGIDGYNWLHGTFCRDEYLMDRIKNDIDIKSNNVIFIDQQKDANMIFY